MKLLPAFFIGAALALASVAQNPPAAPGGTGTPATAVPKAKPFSPGDTHIYITIAEAMQFQLKVSERLRGKMKDSDPGIVSFANKLGKETTDLYTPGVSLAQEHGVPGSAEKKTKGGTIPNDISAGDKASLARVDTMNKDEKKWVVALFELFAKESKKGAAEAEKGAKAAQDADLKAYAEKVAALLKSQHEEIEAKFKELKSAKK